MNKGERKSIYGWTFEQSQFCWLWLKKIWEGEGGLEWAEKNWMKCLESWSTTKVEPAEWTGEVFRRLGKTPPFGDDNFLIKVFLKYFVVSFGDNSFKHAIPLKCDQTINSGGFVYFQWRLNKYRPIQMKGIAYIHSDIPRLLNDMALFVLLNRETGVGWAGQTGEIG